MLEFLTGKYYSSFEVNGQAEKIDLGSTSSTFSGNARVSARNVGQDDIFDVFAIGADTVVINEIVEATLYMTVQGGAISIFTCFKDNRRQWMNRPAQEGKVTHVIRVGRMWLVYDRPTRDIDLSLCDINRKDALSIG